MTNTNKNSFKNPTYRIPYIISCVLFVIIFVTCIVLFNFVPLEISGTIWTLTRLLAYVAALICIAATCAQCAKSNTRNNPDMFIPKRDIIYYIKRMGFITLMIVLMSLAASLVGFPLNAFIGGLLSNNIESSFFQGFWLKLPIFLLFLFLVYKMLIKYGFMDSQNKIFNSNLRILAIIAAVIAMTPDAIHDSMFYTSSIEMLIPNVQTFLSPNLSIYIIESDGYTYFNENFNIIGVLISVLITFIIQTAVFYFAYNRGKKIFIKEHIRKLNEYEMDENI